MPTPATMMPSPRSRIRNMGLDSKSTPVPDSKVTKAMKELATEHFLTNREANAAQSKAKKAREALYKMMRDAGVTDFDLSINDNGSKLELETVIDTPETQVVDVKALRKLVTEQQFMEIIAASQKSVVDVVGKAVATRCLVPAQGTENVSVKVRKV